MTAAVPEDPLTLRGLPRLLVLVLDIAFVFCLMLTLFGFSPVFAFHLAFALLMAMSVIHAGRAFLVRAAIGFVAAVLTVFWAVESGHLVSDELYEIPILSGMTAFVAWSMYQLRRLVQEVSDRSSRLRELHEASELEHREQLLLVQRLDSVGHLSAGVAHNLRNVLTTIWSMAERIEDEAEGTVAVGPAKRIQEQTARGADLLTQLLHHARPRPGPTPSDLVAAAEAEVPSLDIAVGPDIELELTVESRPLSVRTSAALIEQLLVNLVLNSAKATTGEGRIRISIGRGELTSVDGGDPIPAAVLVVADEGVGMTEEIRQRAFEPFFSTDTERDGAGLGLYSALLITEGAGGTITVNPDRPVGCEIVVTLPLADPAEGEELVGHPVEPGVDKLHGTERILVADDEEATRDRLCSILTLYGYQVESAADGPEALDLLRAAPFDLLVSDIMMPGLSGPELVVEARREGIAPDVLFVSAHEDAEDMVPAGSPVLVKPFSRNVFLGQVRQALDERAPA